MGQPPDGLRIAAIRRVVVATTLCAAPASTNLLSHLGVTWMDAGYRIIRLMVHDEPIWRFDDQIAIMEQWHHNLQKVGDVLVEPSQNGYFIYLAVRSFDDLSAARTLLQEGWFRQAERAMKEYHRRQTPTGVLRIYRDPLTGDLRNLAD